ncbi:hypothetical protein J3R80_00965 [Aliiroseovarius sp. Z3]|uniref:hypothetical protein n=1 Tax=Aliiroseovarius sp. Z3 TaxID=2811402 RepID=UPI0023B24A52|nr:hypothetical protein [Aliiroseovarius sp. Z3]MDE9449038.1 hypothetical protein [Aliiroseovarius sp. Z3]
MTITILRTVKWLNQPANNEIVLDLVHTWIELLANKHYQAAFELTGHDSYHSWTPDLIRKVIESYGLPDENSLQKYEVTSVDEAQGGPKPRWEVEWFEQPGTDGRVGEVSAELPLNGTWSDLTAIFEIYLRDDKYALVLNDIHVL